MTGRRQDAYANAAGGGQVRSRHAAAFAAGGIQEAHVRISRTSAAAVLLVASLGLTGCSDAADTQVDVPETVAPGGEGEGGGEGGEGGEGGGEGEGEGGG